MPGRRLPLQNKRGKKNNKGGSSWNSSSNFSTSRRSCLNARGRKRHKLKSGEKKRGKGKRKKRGNKKSLEFLKKKEDNLKKRGKSN
jgi:hypothetical protein